MKQDNVSVNALLVIGLLIMFVITNVQKILKMELIILVFVTKV